MTADADTEERVTGTDSTQGIARELTQESWLRSRAVWEPARAASRMQPVSVQYREWTSEHLDRLLDPWTPLIVDVVSRLDLTKLVARHVDVVARLSRLRYLSRRPPPRTPTTSTTPSVESL
jgi:hypothetical protein